MINELAGRDLVERRPDPADRRRNAISVTDPGRRRLGELDELLAGVQDEVLAALDPGRREQLTGLLGLLVHHASRARGSETPRAS